MKHSFAEFSLPVDSCHIIKNKAVLIGVTSSFLSLASCYTTLSSLIFLNSKLLEIFLGFLWNENIVFYASCESSPILLSCFNVFECCAKFMHECLFHQRVHKKEIFDVQWHGLLSHFVIEIMTERHIM